MREIEFRVFDLYDGKVLYGDQIPEYGEGLPQSIRQMSGQTYELSQYTENHDVDGNKIYEQDIVEVLAVDTKKNFQVEYTKVGEGSVNYYMGVPYVNYFVDGELNSLSLHDRQHDYRVIGNKIEKLD